MEWFSILVGWVVSAFWAVVGFMSPEEWQAAGTLATLVVAIIAALYARGQVKEARTLREEQARPYVVAYLELVDDTTLDLVVKNLGMTAARNVKMRSDMPMKRYWDHEEEELLTFDSLPVLVPGQDWRTLFDSSGDRLNAGNTDVYTVTISATDSRGRPLPEETFVLDWTPIANRHYIERLTLDDLGKSAKNIDKTLKSWTDGIRGLSVVSRDGDKKDIRQRELMDERRRERERQATTDDAQGPAS